MTIIAIHLYEQKNEDENMPKDSVAFKSPFIPINSKNASHDFKKLAAENDRWSYKYGSNSHAGPILCAQIADTEIIKEKLEQMGYTVIYQ